MPKSRLRWRGATTSVVTLACAAAIACDSVLDIEDPKLRPADGGEPASESTAGAGGAAAGAPTVSPEGGAGGEVELGLGGASAGAPGSAGEGGAATVTPLDCDPDSVRCTDRAPEVCDASGHWVPNLAEADGDCAVQCHEGRCVECLPADERCTVCEDGDDACNSNQPQTCVDGAWASEPAACSGFCDGGACQMPRSCPSTAGAQAECANESCCKSLLVPGGTFKRSYDDPSYIDDGEYTDDASPATVSAFRLDKFEVTVGRFRQFVNAFSEFRPSAGDGKSARIAGDEGWSSSFTLPASMEALIAELKCDASATWSDDPIENNALPINCVSFPVAYGFCIWDDARLPTEAEWNFAAAGGSLQRAYPWPRPAGEDAITADHASWDSADPGPLAVGSKPLGNGRWGHADLASNIREWMLDYSAEYPVPCIDCAQWTAAFPRRVVRGGAWHLSQDSLRVSARSELGPNERRFSNGFRCARDVATTNGL